MAQTARNDTMSGRQTMTATRVNANPEQVRAAARRWSLSARQADVLELAVVGQTNREIAERLGATVKTVEAHMTQILRRADLPNRAALIAVFWAGAGVT